LSPEQLNALHVGPGEDVLGRAAQSDKPLNVREPAAAPSPAPQESFLRAPYVVLPLVIRSQVGGLLVLCASRPEGFEERDLRTATLLASQAQGMMENLDLHESIRQGR